MSAKHTFFPHETSPLTTPIRFLNNGSDGAISEQQQKECVWESACEHVVGQGYKVFPTLSLLHPHNHTRTQLKKDRLVIACVGAVKPMLKWWCTWPREVCGSWRPPTAFWLFCGSLWANEITPIHLVTAMHWLWAEGEAAIPSAVLQVRSVQNIFKKSGFLNWMCILSFLNQQPFSALPSNSY